jgi:eukaryotic-like serine/threonine-protein kinase
MEMSLACRDFKYWQQVKKIFQAAIELSPAERSAYLIEACAGDHLLRAEVESLIAAHEEPDSFLDAPAFDLAAIATTKRDNNTLLGHPLGHYRILSLLGSGGMGEVYLGEDVRLERKVALKLLPVHFTDDADRLRRFEQEARVASSLNHPNIITVYEIGKAGEIHFMATEYIEGQTLRQRMRDVPIPFGEGLGIAIQIASALSAAHTAGIIHRDIKPENVMLRPDGYVKVLDFGLAKLIERQVFRETEAPLSTNETTSGVIMGSPYYMSPEQARGLRVDKRTDIYSLGVVFDEMIHGRAPFNVAVAADAGNEIAMPAKHRSAIATELQQIIDKALAQDRESRYQRIEDFLNDLRCFKQKLDYEQLMAPPMFGWRRVVLAGTILLVLVIIAYFILGHLWPVKEAAAEPVTLAVLPFHTLNAPEDIRFLGIGIPNEIITRLSGVRKLRLRPTNVVLRYENQSINPQEAGQALASEYLLTGMVMKVGEQLRVSVQLVRAKDSSPLWGDRYDVRRQDLLGLQDSIAERVSAALKIRMTAEESERFYRRYTGNAVAYELYLQGRAHLGRAGREEKLAAVRAFENALRLDPQYALAHAGLAAACGSMRHRLATESEVKTWEDRAKRSASRALELDPDLAEAYEALAAVYRYTDFDWKQTIENSRKALDLNPNLDQPHYYLARAYYHLGLFELIEPELRAALEINLENRGEPTQLRIIAAIFTRRVAEAAAQYEELNRLSGEAHPRWALVYLYNGESKRAEAMLTEIIRDGETAPRLQLEGKSILASLLAARGARKEAEAILRDVSSTTETFHHASYSIGAAYAQLGDLPKARLWLARAAEDGFPCYPWYRDDPLLLPLQGDREFQRFMADLKREWEATKVRLRSSS